MSPCMFVQLSVLDVSLTGEKLFPLRYFSIFKIKRLFLEIQ